MNLQLNLSGLPQTLLSKVAILLSSPRAGALLGRFTLSSLSSPSLDAKYIRAVSCPTLENQPHTKDSFFIKSWGYVVGRILHPVHLLTYSLFSVLVWSTFAVDQTEALTVLYSGEEHGQLGLHGCGNEQVGGLAHRHTLISNLRTDFDAVLNVHTGNLIDATDDNAEWIYQIGLSALDVMDVDVLYQINPICSARSPCLAMLTLSNK